MALTAVVATSAGACDRHEESARSVSDSLARPGVVTAPPWVTLPDLSRLAASVQTQIREQHSALNAKLANRSTPRAELGAAYGELGLTLMAVEYYEVAASCYRSAQSLVP